MLQMVATPEELDPGHHWFLVEEAALLLLLLLVEVGRGVGLSFVLRFRYWMARTKVALSCAVKAVGLFGGLSVPPSQPRGRLMQEVLRGSVPSRRYRDCAQLHFLQTNEEQGA